MTCNYERGYERGYEAGLAAGKAAGPAKPLDEIVQADRELAIRFGLELGQMTKVWRDHDGKVIGAVGL